MESRQNYFKDEEFQGEAVAKAMHSIVIEDSTRVRRTCIPEN